MIQILTHVIGLSIHLIGIMTPFLHGLCDRSSQLIRDLFVRIENEDIILCGEVYSVLHLNGIVDPGVEIDFSVEFLLDFKGSIR